MTITASWDETTPNNATNIRDGDDAIVAVKTATRERMRNGGHIWETSFPSTDQEAGRHACNVEFASSGSGAAAHEWYVYDTDGSTKVLIVKGASHATPGMELVAGTLKVPAVEVTGALSVTGATTFTTPLTQGQLADGVAHGVSQNFGGSYLGALAVNQVLASQAYAPATIPGRVLIFFSTFYSGNGSAGVFTLQAQVERTTGSGTWTNLAGLAGLYDAPNGDDRQFFGIVYDALATTNSANCTYRVLANHSSGTNNYSFQSIGITIFELRR